MRANLSQRNRIQILILALFLLLLNDCTIKLVQSYDEQLIKKTEAFYEKAAGMIEEGLMVSPRTDEERSKITDPINHKGHYSNFEKTYRKLITDSELLIMRALSKSNEIDPLGNKIQSILDSLIETTIPSVCRGLAEEFGTTSLTVKNYIDLKCIVTKWKDRHADSTFTEGKLIIKRVNWEARKNLLFNAILLIQRTEGFKKNE